MHYIAILLVITTFATCEETSVNMAADHSETSSETSKFKSLTSPDKLYYFFYSPESMYGTSAIVKETGEKIFFSFAASDEHASEYGQKCKHLVWTGRYRDLRDDFHTKEIYVTERDASRCYDATHDERLVWTERYRDLRDDFYATENRVPEGV